MVKIADKLLWKCQGDQLLRQPLSTVQTSYFSTPKDHSVPLDVPLRLDLPYKVVPVSVILHTQVPSSTE